MPNPFDTDAISEVLRPKPAVGHGSFRPVRSSALARTGRARRSTIRRRTISRPIDAYSTSASGHIDRTVLAIYPSMHAQETRVVSGVVEDAKSGAPVSDALVTIRGTGLSVVTDPDGRFELAGVPVGSLQLVLRHVAYGEQAEALIVEA